MEIKALIILLSIAFLTGCGGGESNNTAITGIYLDAKVQGLNYSTAT